MRILSGIKPTGTIHIGNYLGMIHPMVESQQRGELFCFIANMHSLTSVSCGDQMRQFTSEALLDLLALGIDPDRSTLWVQSDVPEVSELAWYLSNVTPVGLLERCHAYKDATTKNMPANTGLFTYPVLMAADILMFQSNIVPVGRDQKQHLEVTRDLAVKFNGLYKEDIFTIPDAEIINDLATVPGTDGQKMSKSYNNTLEVFGEEKKLRKKVMSIVTDPTQVEEPKDPDTSTLFALYRLFASNEQTTAMANRFRAGGLGYGTVKKELFELLWEHFSGCRKKREQIAADPGYLDEIRKKGAKKARAVATTTMDRVRKLVGVL